MLEADIRSEIGRLVETSDLRGSGPAPVTHGVPGLKPLCLPCAQLQVSFRKRATDFRALLQELSYRDNASYVYSPPCKWPASPTCRSFLVVCVFVCI